MTKDGTQFPLRPFFTMGLRAVAPLRQNPNPYQILVVLSVGITSVLLEHTISLHQRIVAVFVFQDVVFIAMALTDYKEAIGGYLDLKKILANIGIVAGTESPEPAWLLGPPHSWSWLWAFRCIVIFFLLVGSSQAETGGPPSPVSLTG